MFEFKTGRLFVKHPVCKRTPLFLKFRMCCSLLFWKFNVIKRMPEYSFAAASNQTVIMEYSL